MGQELTTKRVKGKIIFKHETEADWGQSNYIPEQGEKILYDPDESHNYTRVKYGDGSHTVKDLPFSPSDKIPQFPATTRDKVLTVNKEGEAEWKDYANLPVFDDVDEVPEDFPEESVYLIPADNGSFVTKVEMAARVDREVVNRTTEINIQKERIDELTKLVPEVISSDKDKVLTANEDGTAEWKEPTGSEPYITVTYDLKGQTEGRLDEEICEKLFNAKVPVYADVTCNRWDSDYNGHIMNYKGFMGVSVEENRAPIYTLTNPRFNATVTISFIVNPSDESQREAWVSCPYM